MTKRNIPPRRFIKPTFEFLIEKKRDGGEFNKDEIRYIVDSTLDGEMPKHQLAALAMASSPAGILRVVHELRSAGQVTERVMHLTAINCMLSVLALKLGSVLQLETRERRPVRLQFLAASAGIIASFWMLAAMSTLLRATQGAVGWGIQFQSVWFIGFMVVVTALLFGKMVVLL